jgi:L-lactate dehydrogenase complex protein LldG
MAQKTPMTNARDAILQTLRAATGPARTVPAYGLPAWSGDTADAFMEKARATIAQIHQIASPLDAPEAILALLFEAKAAPRLHIPAPSPLNNLPWQRAPGLTRTGEPPSGEDAAFSAADWGIAETGTLAFFSGPRTPSSWHFRPGREIVLLDRASILPRMEDVLARLQAMPATLNLVTGPSRTADIEQTIELGAHGPRHLHILVAGPIS